MASFLNFNAALLFTKHAGNVFAQHCNYFCNFFRDYIRPLKTLYPYNELWKYSSFLANVIGRKEEERSTEKLREGRIFSHSQWNADTMALCNRKGVLNTDLIT